MAQEQGFRFQDFYEPPTKKAASEPTAAPEPEPEPTCAPEPEFVWKNEDRPLQSWQDWPTPEAFQEPEQDAPAPQALQAREPWTGLQKFGWLLIGMFGGLLGILVASMTNVGHPNRSDATRMAVIGLLVAMALGLLGVFAAAYAYASLASAGLSALM